MIPDAFVKQINDKACVLSEIVKQDIGYLLHVPGEMLPYLFDYDYHKVNVSKIWVECERFSVLLNQDTIVKQYRIKLNDQRKIIIVEVEGSDPIKERLLTDKK